MRLRGAAALESQPGARCFTSAFRCHRLQACCLWRESCCGTAPRWSSPPTLRQPSMTSRLPSWTRCCRRSAQSAGGCGGCPVALSCHLLPCTLHWCVRGAGLPSSVVAFHVVVRTPPSCGLVSPQVAAADPLLCKGISSRQLQVVPSGSGLPVIDLSQASWRHSCGAGASAG